MLKVASKILFQPGLKAKGPCQVNQEKISPSVYATNVTVPGIMIRAPAASIIN